MDEVAIRYTTRYVTKEHERFKKKQPLKPKNEMITIPKLRDEIYDTQRSEKYIQAIPETVLQKNNTSKTSTSSTQFMDSRQKMLLTSYLAVLERFSDKSKCTDVYIEKVFSIYTDISIHRKLWFEHIIDVTTERTRTIYNSEIVIHVLNTLVAIKARKGQFQYIIRHILPLFEQILIRANEIIGIPEKSETIKCYSKSDMIVSPPESNADSDSSNVEKITVEISENHAVCMISMFGAYINIAHIYAAVGLRRQAAIAYHTSFLTLKPTKLLKWRIGGVPDEYSSETEVWRWLRKQQYLAIYPCKETAYKFGVY